ncbi:MAG: HipA domain-containing protein, partial [Bacteroidota bacterium]
NGDAHLKNFSVLETPMGDHRLSPAYDLLNTRIHVEDEAFALKEGLLPGNLGQADTAKQFQILAEQIDLSKKQFDTIFNTLLSNPEHVENFVYSSFLNEKSKRNYLQDYQTRLKKLQKMS